MARLCVVAVSFCCLAAVASVQQYSHATSYVYRTDHGGPVNYVNVRPTDGAVYYHQPQVFAAPIPVVAAPSHVKVEPKVVKGVRKETSSEGESVENVEYDGDDYDGHIDDNKSDGEKDDSQDIGEGNAYGGAHHSAQGEASSKGYKSHHGYRKGDSGIHGADNHKGFYNKGAGNEDKHFDEADEYGKNYEASKGQKGEDFSHKKSHSKGEETTGFHKVYSKDEFKKDHVFYDNADDSGHFNKHSSGGYHHHSAAGGHKKGGHHDSGHKEGNFGKEGHYDHGSHHDADKGYSGKGGDEGNYSHHGDYAKKGGHENGKKFAYGKVY